MITEYQEPMNITSLPPYLHPPAPSLGFRDSFFDDDEVSLASSKDSALSNSAFKYKPPPVSRSSFPLLVRIHSQEHVSPDVDRGINELQVAVKKHQTRDYRAETYGVSIADGMEDTGYVTPKGDPILRRKSESYRLESSLSFLYFHCANFFGGEAGPESICPKLGEDMDPTLNPQPTPANMSDEVEMTEIPTATGLASAREVRMAKLASKKKIVKAKTLNFLKGALKSPSFEDEPSAQPVTEQPHLTPLTPAPKRHRTQLYSLNPDQPSVYGYSAWNSPANFGVGIEPIARADKFQIFSDSAPERLLQHHEQNRAAKEKEQDLQREAFEAADKNRKKQMETILNCLQHVGDIAVAGTLAAAISKSELTKVTRIHASELSYPSLMEINDTLEEWKRRAPFLVDEQETTRSGTVKIWEKFNAEFQFPSNQGVGVPVHGDHATLQNVGSAQAIRKFEHYSSDVEQFKHPQRVPGDFHRQMSIISGTARKFGKTKAKGSASHFAKLQNKVLNFKKFAFYEMESALNGVFECYLEELLAMLIDKEALVGASEEKIQEYCDAIAMQTVKMLFEQSSYSRHTYEHQGPTYKTMKHVFKPAIEHAYKNYVVQFVSHYSRYKVYVNCIKRGDGEGILILVRLLLPFFKKNCVKYCNGGANELIDHASIFSEHDSKLISDNRFLNSTGKPASNYPVDLGFEHYVRDFKAMEGRAGTNQNWEHTKRVSLVAPYLRELSDKLFSDLGLSRNTYHRDVNSGNEREIFKSTVRELLQEGHTDNPTEFELDCEEESAEMLSNGYLTALIEARKRSDVMEDESAESDFEGTIE
ncbi:hypothetical protein BDR26DRAFT_1011567 [Obelidium mucronatum]|nr:hypothetical protein BDR26DRAFT_1011567 [Obelidium mucronatum]